MSEVSAGAGIVSGTCSISLQTASPRAMNCAFVSLPEGLPLAADSCLPEHALREVAARPIATASASLPDITQTLVGAVRRVNESRHLGQMVYVGVPGWEN